MKKKKFSNRAKKRSHALYEIINSNKTLVLPYPKKGSEAEIQALLWMKLKQIDCDARMEVCHRVNVNGTTIQSRFDIVVYKDKKAVCIVEVKNGRNLSPTGRQMNKYMCYGLPLMICSTENQCDEICRKIKEMQG